MKLLTPSFLELSTQFRLGTFDSAVMNNKYKCNNSLFTPIECSSKYFSRLAILIPFRDDPKEHFKLYNLKVICRCQSLYFFTLIYKFIYIINFLIKTGSSERRSAEMAIILSYSVTPKVKICLISEK